MSSHLSGMFQFATKDVQSMSISIIIGLLTVFMFYLIKFYSRLSKYPKGPFPLPIIGNMRLFKGRMIHDVMYELRDIYGDVFTVWMGSTPTVIFASHDSINEAFLTKRNDFAGRPQFFFRPFAMANSNGHDVVLEDWGRPWEVLRRLAHSASRKFSISPQLPKIAVNIVDEVVELILKEKGLNEPFNPKEYIHLMVYSLTCSIAAGKSYSVNDDEFIKLKHASDVAISLQGDLQVVEFLPLIRYFYGYRKKWNQFVDAVKVNTNWCKVQMAVHLARNENEAAKEEVNDFCDALINARNEADQNDSQTIKYLTIDNLENLLHNLFDAGSETTRMTLDWAFLLMANYPEIQTKLRDDIDEVIKYEIPTNDHRIKCHYVQSFMAEVSRFAPLLPVGFPHKAIKDSSVCGQNIPKDTNVLALHDAQLRGKELWEDAEQFKPERFIVDGVFNGRINNANVSFGIGRRSCLGEKLAVIDLFIIITRVLQKTKGYQIVLKNGPGSVSLKPDLKQPATYGTVDHELIIADGSF